MCNSNKKTENLFNTSQFLIHSTIQTCAIVQVGLRLNEKNNILFYYKFNLTKCFSNYSKFTIVVLGC